MSLNTASLVGLWLRGQLRHRLGRISATSIGIALAVGLFASIAAFLSASKATMTTRAIGRVAVDWQVETQPGADPAAVADRVRALPLTRASESVPFATADGLELTKRGSTQTTGTARIVGLSDTYRATFPALLRDLNGSGRGVLLYQQTASNLQATVGDTITVRRAAGLAPVTLTIDGVVDITKADSLFQHVGAPSGAQPKAPPDNVVFVPGALWHQLFDPLAAARPDLVTSQQHVEIDHRLPSDPSSAYATVAARARNLEAQLHGTGLVGDNLGATLASARADSLYAQVLFLFLGAPGATLAGLLTYQVAAAGRDRRRREQALLRTRGATTRLLVVLAAAEAVVTGTIGSAAGLGLAALIGRTMFATTRFGATPASVFVWGGAAVAAGMAIAIASIAVPARRDARASTVAAARRIVGRGGAPRWLRWHLDLLALGLAALVFWMTSRNGYKLVLAVEGVPTISVSYWAFAGPAMLWIGGGLLAYRLAAGVAGRGRRVVAAILRPRARTLADTVAATISRQRASVARSAVLAALTVAFAASTAIFNATYRHQAEVDAVLTNGADVTATVSPGTALTPSFAANIARVGGVRHVEPIQHRFAYVGADLQDLYGVNPATIGSAGKLQNAYFAGGTAAQLLHRLSARPDGLLVSAETVKDFQLHPDDPITLRLQDGRTKQFRDVAFHYVGVAKEFPTAPRDSFLVANADYVAAQTGTDAVGAFLVDTAGVNVVTTADAVRAAVGDRAAVTDIARSRRIIGSSLTAVDLAGLTKVELGFAVALAAAATGLTLWLGLAERRRTFAIAKSLGATRRQLGSFVTAEAVLVATLGLVQGAGIGWLLANMLVKVLHGVFDPAPSGLSTPWTYLVAVLSIAAAATAVAVRATLRAARHTGVDVLRST